MKTWNHSPKLFSSKIYGIVTKAFHVSVKFRRSPSSTEFGTVCKLQISYLKFIAKKKKKQIEQLFDSLNIVYRLCTFSLGSWTTITAYWNSGINIGKAPSIYVPITCINFLIYFNLIDMQLLLHKLGISNRGWRKLLSRVVYNLVLSPFNTVLHLFIHRFASIHSINLHVR